MCFSYLYPMKTLYIIRHGKSAWDNPSVRDHDRTLLPEGIERTKKVAKFLADKNIKPDLIVSSSATRAFETAKIIAHQLHYPEADIRVETDIYDQGTAYLMELLYGLPNEVSSVMLIGHNPTFTHFANKFMDKSIDALATTGTVSISFNTDKWEELHLASKITNFVVVPKMLKH